MLKKSIFQRIFISFVFAVLMTTTAFAQTTAFNYQGKLNDNGNPADGTVQMEFKLFDALVGGNQIGATLSDVSVTAENGVFSTSLDFGASIFTGNDLFLEIAVRRNAGENYTTLSPRERVASSPYAIRSLSSAQADVALDSNKLGGLDASEYVTTATVGSDFINNSTTEQTADFNISGNGIVGNSLGIGGTPQTGLQLDVTGNSVFRTANGNVNLGTPNSETGLTISSNSNRADFRFNGSTLKIVAGFGIGPASDFNGIAINTAGNVGIGTTTPTQKLDVFGGMRTLFNGSTQIISETTGGTNSWARLYMRTPNRSWFIGTSQNFNDDQFYLFDETSGQSRMTIQPNGGAIAFPFGNIGIGTSTPTVKLEVVGNTIFTAGGSGGKVQFGTPSGETGMTIVGINRADVRFDGTTLKLLAGTGTGAMASTNGINIKLDGNVGIGTTNPTEKLEVVGTMKTSILQITGGSDLAEKFEFTETVKPGMVVAIDLLQPGKLSISRTAYNRRVVGVISGANNLAAGMILPNLNNAENMMPVALAGRVWVYCDATQQPINPGDLLTTSATPGHAMKVTNFSKAQGAILGKALTGLKSGKGLVLVLVTLQ